MRRAESVVDVHDREPGRAARERRVQDVRPPSATPWPTEVGTRLAHSTHVKGQGRFDATTGVESPRVTVTLVTGISPERRRRINLAYRDPASIDLTAWSGREREGILVVPRAGEMLYRLKR